LGGFGALLRGRSATAARLVAASAGAAVATLLAVASLRFVLQERAGGGVLAYDIPRWFVQLAMPLGFGAIAVRQFWHAATGWGHRLGSLGLAAALGTAGAFAPTGIALAGLFAATLLGTPIFAALGGAALVLLFGSGSPAASIAIDHYSLVTNPALPAIPLFTLAGYFMAEGGASRRLVRLFQALSGWLRSGPAIATALICAFFTAFTGGSGVTVLALGGLLLPVLVAARLSDRDALGLITGAGSLGILLPPCLPVILYAIIAKVDINTMFLAGLLPGVLLIVLTAAWGVWAAHKRSDAGIVSGRPACQGRDFRNHHREPIPPLPGLAGPHHDSTPVSSRFDGLELCRALWAAKWELLLPVVALTTLFSGWATPVEAAAVTAGFAFFIEVVVHRDLHLWRDCPRVMTEAGLLIGGILLILGVALGLTNHLIHEGVPDALADWSLEHVRSRWLFLLGLNVILILIGSVVEIFAAIVVVVPLLVPIGQQLGIDPIHLGIIFLANMELGFLAPPFGLNLLLAASRLKRPIGEVARATLPLLAVMFLGVLLITYLPALTTWLPQLLSPPAS
ncbi:MAG: TRAP transporter large permease subunit, partial [Verrucomicrobia bacterium]|nr:TRAP transporter large permease subunit [Verrucomicrobiota bacterium]